MVLEIFFRHLFGKSEKWTFINDQNSISQKLLGFFLSFFVFTPFYISNADCKSTNKEYAKHKPCPNASLVSFNNNSNFSVDI